MKRERCTARSVALQALLQMDKNSGYSNIVLGKVLDGSGLDNRDKALASAVFYGALQRRITLDYYLSKFVTPPGRKLDAIVKEALRCGAYQILYMDRIPDSAAVNETVDAVKLLGRPGVAGFVNGVLRELLRNCSSLSLPEGNSPAALSLRYSAPEELIELWVRSYGASPTAKILESFAEKPELYVRINTLRCDADQLSGLLAAESVKLTGLSDPPGAAVLEGSGAPQELEAFKRGLFHVQDLSAQWICRILDPKPGEIVCDCCAAPGGKAFTIAQQLGDGKMYAMDLYESRVRLIKSGAKRLGLENVCAKVNDAAKGLGDVPQVDKLLCDVPCSGYGVIRRKPEIRYKALETIKSLPELQYSILAAASKQVRPGGTIVYSTCTLNPEENNRVAERFLNENSGYEPMNIDIGAAQSFEEPAYMLTMTPYAGASDGFFAAAFRKVR